MCLALLRSEGNLKAHMAVNKVTGSPEDINIPRELSLNAFTYKSCELLQRL